MARMDELKKTFFAESNEQLEAMETGLTDLREGSGSNDTINAVFRAVHSIKGGAGIFGYERLVEFSHVFENVLDAIRHGNLAASPDAIDVLFAAGDMLTDLVESARSDVDLPSNYEADCRTVLERVMGHSPADVTSAVEFAPLADFDGIDFTPVRADNFDSEGENTTEQTIEQIAQAGAPVAAIDDATDVAQDGPTEAARYARLDSVAKSATTTIRVDLDRIDRVVNMVGELVIAQAMLSQNVQELPEETSHRIWKAFDEVAHHTRELKDSVMAMRAQPVKSVFQRMTRLVRELSIKTGKKVHLEMSGENTEVDKTIIECLSDPLVHIIRNSIDHGIELPAVRSAQGKNEMGTVRLSADQRGGRIVIEVSDDGAGINAERVLQKAREKGLVGEGDALSEEEINNLVFLPEFSTVETASEISGRGVGMDVVRRNILDIGGRITLKSVAGRGMTIQLALPLTLAVMDSMIIRAGNETFVLPISAIVECLRPNRSDVRDLLGTRGTLQLRGAVVPLVNLVDLLQVEGAAQAAYDGVVIVVETSDGVRVGLVVDELCGHQQVVIKSIEENYHCIAGIAAATILGNGSVAFILDIEKLPELAQEAENQPPRSAKSQEVRSAAA
jgi:chemotaxis protein histidine kinase CheA